MSRSLKGILLALVGAFIIFTFPVAALNMTLRVAADVSADSPWEQGLERLAADFDRITNGRVRIVFPQSVRVSNESDVIQKLRFGIDGALLTSLGIAELYPDSLAISRPTLIRGDKEPDAVLEAIKPLKIKNAGVRTVEGNLSGLLLQLNSNEVDAFYLSPVFAASLWSELKGKVSYMSSFRVSPFIGAAVLNRSSWERIPAEFRPKLEEATQEVATQMAADSSALEYRAISALMSIMDAALAKAKRRHISSVIMAGEMT